MVWLYNLEAGRSSYPSANLFVAHFQVVFEHIASYYRWKEPALIDTYLNGSTKTQELQLIYVVDTMKQII